MNTVSKALLGTVAAGAMAVTSATPAAARDRHNDGISAGEVIAGAVILGGIAAIASSIGKDRNRYRDDYRYNTSYRDQYYQARGNPRSAVDICVNAVRSQAARYGFRGVNIPEIRGVNDTRYGWRVKGRVAVDEDRRYGYRDQRYGYRDQRGYNRNVRYDRNNYGRYGYNANSKDFGSFTCDIQRGRVVDIDFDGIRGLR